jgi:adenosylcobinamide kinase / adenosylcobinamide-phosphate guanylyltransferase
LGKLILVTGGAKSGKSSFAEGLTKRIGENILYIATAIPFDEEMKLKIHRHREQRPSNWETLEAYKDFDKNLQGRIAGKSACMLDCITIMLSNIVFEESIEWDKICAEDFKMLESKAKDEVEKLLNVIACSDIPFVVVTNEIGMGIVPDNALARMFRDIAGRANQILAKAAEEVYFCVSGIPMKIK